MTRLLKAVLPLVVGLAGCKGTPPPKDEETSAPDIVELDSAQQAAANLSLGIVTALPADTINLTGTIAFDASRESHVGPRTQGRIRRAYVDIGSRVGVGDTLAVLDSPELGAAQARWAQARANRDVATRNYDRTLRLQRDGIVSDRRRLETEAELRSREAELAAAQQALMALGAEADTAATGLFVLRAPIEGEVVEKHAVAGEVVGPESTLFIVGGLERVWLLLDLYETDLPRAQQGQSVRVTSDAYPERPFAARIALVSSIVDTVSRTVKVRVEIPNPTHLLKPGMFARAAIAVAAPPGAIGIPHVAVQSLEGHDAVFTPAGAGRFRAVRVGRDPPRAGGWVRVSDGLQRGDTIVVGGSFALKAHMLRATFGEPD